MLNESKKEEESYLLKIKMFIDPSPSVFLKYVI